MTDIRAGEWVKAEGDEGALAGNMPWRVASLFAGADGLGDGIWVTRKIAQPSGGVVTEARRLAHYRRTEAPPTKMGGRK